MEKLLINSIEDFNRKIRPGDFLKIDYKSDYHNFYFHDELELTNFDNKNSGKYYVYVVPSFSQKKEINFPEYLIFIEPKEIDDEVYFFFLRQTKLVKINATEMFQETGAGGIGDIIIRTLEIWKY